jgi:hypothetical protein
MVTIFNLSNFNNAATITINRIVVYGFGGAVLCDTDLGDITTPPNIIEPIVPNGGKWFNLVPGNCPGLNETLTVTQNYNVKIYWSSSDGYRNPLYGQALLRHLNAEGSVEATAAWECIPVK